MVAEEEPIHIFAIGEEFSSQGQLIEEARKTLQLLPHAKVILLFPEAVLGKNAIGRIEGKKLAMAMHEVLKAHGNAYAAYSVIEKAGRKTSGGTTKEFITNSGYVVLPTRGKSYSNSMTGQVPYIVYPKITTFRNGQSLTVSDIKMLKVYLADSPEMSRAVARQVKLIKKIRAFPSFNVGKTRVQIRVCADFTQWPKKDSHPAMEKKGRFHLILVPANGLPLDPPQIAYIANHLKSNGIGLVMDKRASEWQSHGKPNSILTAVHFDELGRVIPKTLKSNEAHSIGRFRIIHRQH